MKYTLFSVALVGLGVVVLGGFENGDGVPQPTPKEWAARNDALSRAKVFRDEPFDAAIHRLRRRPQSRRRRTDTHELQIQAGRSQRHDAEVRLRAPERRKNQSEVQLVEGDTIGDRGDAPAARPGIRRRPRVARRDVRCYGCPFQPFHTRALLEMLNLDGYADKRIDYSSHRDFKKVSVERNLEGEAIEVGNERGWAFHELDRIDPSRGGATPAEIDALRLMAIFLHHWDNKSSNQRLTCAERRDGRLRPPARDDSGRGIRVRAEESWTSATGARSPSGTTRKRASSR